MNVAKNFAWVGVLVCLFGAGCGGQAARSTSEPAPESMPAASTDPSALMGGELESDTGGGAGAAPTN